MTSFAGQPVRHRLLATATVDFFRYQYPRNIKLYQGGLHQNCPRARQLLVQDSGCRIRSEKGGSSPSKDLTLSVPPTIATAYG